LLFDVIGVVVVVVVMMTLLLLRMMNGFLVRAANPGKTLAQLAKLAWLQQINLSANGFFNRPDIGYNFAAKSGKPFAYYVTGAACTQVEVDTLTGDYQVTIVMSFTSVLFCMFNHGWYRSSGATS